MPGEKRRTLAEKQPEKQPERRQANGNTWLETRPFLFCPFFTMGISRVQRLLYPRFVWVVVMVMKCG